MGFMDVFFDALRLNDDDDEFDNEEYDDFEDEEEEEEGRRFFRRRAREESQPEPVRTSSRSTRNREEASVRQNDSAPRRASQTQAAEVPAADRPQKSQFRTTTARRNQGKKEDQMEVSVIKPSAVDDEREITETLLSGRAVVINMEGLNVDIAQRIIDFTSGVTFAIEGTLQKISNFIFIATPKNVDVSGDLQTIMDSVGGSSFTF